MKTKNCILVITPVLLMLCAPAPAQVTQAWVARYNGPASGIDAAKALAVDAAGHVHVAGASEGSGSAADLVTIKYGPGGTPLWTNRYNGPGNSNDWATALALDAAGNVHVAGYSYGSNTNYVTLKYLANGTPAWTNVYNGPGNAGDRANALAVDGDGNVFVSGRSRGSGTGDDFATIKYSAAGAPLWTNRYNGPGNASDGATALAVDGTGDVYVTGSSEGSSSGTDYATIKYAGDGTPLWTNRYNGPGNAGDDPVAVALDGAGRIHVTGKSRGSSTSDDYATVKYDPSGHQLWVARYDGPNHGTDAPTALAVDTAGHVHVTGKSRDSNDDYATIKYDANGTPVWTNRYNGTGDSTDGATAVALDAAGNVCVTGVARASSGGDDYATVKYTGNGTPVWTNRYNGPGNSTDSAAALVVDGAGQVHVTGGSRSTNSSSSEDYATLKLVQTGWPVITAPPLDQAAVVGSDVTFSATATGAAPLRCQWLFQERRIAGATNATLLLRQVQPQAAGDYAVTIANAVGLVASPSARLTLHYPPAISEQPESQSVLPGTAPTLRVVTTGTPPLGYQWRCWGTNLAGATGPALTLAGFEASQAGPYVVVVTNAFGAITSAVAELSASMTDSQAPTRPTSLSLTAKTATSVSLTWDAATDNAGVSRYDILCEGALVGSSPSNSFACTGLASNRAVTFRVKARDAAGNVSDASNALLATPEAGVGQVEPVLVRTQFHALVLNYDPDILVDGSCVRAADHYGYRDVDKLLEEYIRLLRCASGGQTVWSVADRFDLDEFPPPADHAQPIWTAENYIQLASQGYGYGSGPGYDDMLHDARFGILDKVNAGAVDAIWVFAPSGCGFWETAMAGPSAYWVNGPEMIETALNRNVVFYGFGRLGHQGVGFMCENTCHMTENILNNRIAPGWPRSVSNGTFVTLNTANPARSLVTNGINEWVHFVQAEAASWDPVLVAPGDSQAGLSHYPPTALHNYNWSTVNVDFNWFTPYDGTWFMTNGEYRALAGNGTKVLALDSWRLSDNLGPYYPPMAFSDGDVELALAVMNGASASHAGFLFRVSACQAGANQVNGYYVGLDAHGAQVVLSKLSHAWMPLTNAPCPIAPGVTHRLRLELRGSQIRVFVDGSLTPLISITDDTYITGGFGLTTYSTEASFASLQIVAHTLSRADDWYAYPGGRGAARYLSPLEWSGERETAMDGFYGWWWEHLPKNGGGHYQADPVTGQDTLLLNTWWPYVFDINRFASNCPFRDIVFPPEDVTPPRAPASLEALPLGASQVGLSWTEAADNIGVTRYAVYRNGTLLRKTALPYIIDERLAPGAACTYLVKSCDGSGNVSATGAQVSVTTLQTDPQGTVLNSGFEVNPLVTRWSSGAYTSGAQFTWEPAGRGRQTTRCVSINATRFNDAAWNQTVNGLMPGATYWICGWIKGENIVMGGGVGANLCLAGTWDHSADGLAGTFDWQQVSFSFVAPSSGTITLGCRLGYWGNTASGKVWFDDIQIIRPNEVRLDQPRLSASGLFQFQFSASPGRTYRIEQSSDLSAWQEFRTLYLVHPIAEFSDTNSPALPARFYRAVQVGAGASAGGR